MNILKKGRNIFADCIPGLGQVDEVLQSKIVISEEYGNVKKYEFSSPIFKLLFMRATTVVVPASAFLAYKINTLGLGSLAGKLLGMLAPKWLASLAVLKLGSLAAVGLSFSYFMVIGLLAYGAYITLTCLISLALFFTRSQSDDDCPCREVLIRGLCFFLLVIVALNSMPLALVTLDLRGLDQSRKCVMRELSDIFTTPLSEALPTLCIWSSEQWNDQSMRS